MKRTTKSLLITSLILFCAGLLLALGSSLFVKIKNIDAYGVTEKAAVIENKTVTLGEILSSSPESNYVKKLSKKEFLRIDVTSFAGDLIIRKADETSLELQNTNTANFSYEIVGETLVLSEVDPVGNMGIYVDKDGFSFKGLRHIFGPGNTTNSERVVILNLSPEQEIDQIKINSKIGDITLEEVSADKIEVSSFAGDIKLCNIQEKETQIEVKSDFANVEISDCVYAGCSVTTKVGNIKADVSSLDCLSTVLEAWLGEITVSTDVPTKEFKLSLSTGFGSIHRNGENMGKEMKSDATYPNRITSTLFFGNVDLSFSGGDESQYVQLNAEPETGEAEQNGTEESPTPNEEGQMVSENTENAVES